MREEVKHVKCLRASFDSNAFSISSRALLDSECIIKAFKFNSRWHLIGNGKTLELDVLVGTSFSQLTKHYLPKRQAQSKEERGMVIGTTSTPLSPRGCQQER